MRLLVRRSTIVFLFGLMLAVSCSDDLTTARNTDFSAEEPFSIDVARKARTALRVEASNGNINITGSAGAAFISVAGVRRVESDSYEDAETHLAKLKVVVDSTETEVVVRTAEPLVKAGRNYIVNYTISVPQDFSVRVGNANGDVTVESLESDVVVQSANGRLRGNAIEGSTTMSVGNGEIGATVTLPPAGLIDLGVANGQIDLNIPQNTSAKFTATVANGSITVTNLTLSNMTKTPTFVTGTLGDGDGVISLDVGNGTIEVQGW